MSLRQWLQKEGVFDTDIETVLIECNVDSEETFIALSKTDLEEFERKVTVLRAKDLKDQAAKQRSEKKLSKLRKIWSTGNGQNTAAKVDATANDTSDVDAETDEKTQGGHGGNVSAQANNEALAKARGLKAWMQKESIWEKDLFGVLVQKGIVGENEDNISEEFIEKLGKRSEFEEVIRDVKVLRAQDLKDSDARLRLEKLLTKFEKQWETMTGNKKTNIKKGSKAEQGQTRDDPKSDAIANMANEGRELKAWMQKQACWQKDLFDELMALEMSNPDNIKNLTSEQFDEVVRKVRVAKAQELKDTQAKQRIEKVLTKFEKEWRKASGIKKTTITKNSKAGKGGKKAGKAPADEKIDEMASGNGQALKKYMQKEKFWQIDLYNELLALGVSDAATLSKKKVGEIDEVIRKVRVAKAQELKDTQAKQRIEKVLTTFEKEWMKQSGYKKTTINKNSKAAKGGKKAKAAPKDAKNDEMNTVGKDLKEWMKKESIWNKDLYDQLLASNINGIDDLKALDEKAMDEIVRKVRVDTVAKLKDAKARNRVDKLLVNFEKKWKSVCA